MVNTIRQQLSPQEREIWFRCAGRKLRELQDEAARPMPRGKSSLYGSCPSNPDEESLILQHQDMSEEEQAAWRGNILRKASQLFQRSSAGPLQVTPHPPAFGFCPMILESARRKGLN